LPVRYEIVNRVKNPYTFSHGVNAPGEILLTGFAKPYQKKSKGFKKLTKSFPRLAEREYIFL